ncbi:MAG TPA: serine protease [Gemmatimonadaceae bacterium]|jgi:hypothetical protein
MKIDLSRSQEQMLFTTVRIEGTLANGGTTTGTGFIFERRIGDDRIPFIVTNRHVVGDVKSGAIFFHIGEGEQPKLGNGYKLDIIDFDAMWVFHPDKTVDVAVVPLGPLLKTPTQAGVKLFYRSIPTEFLATDAQLASLSVLQRVVFIGYPNGLWDSANLLPIARTGSIATLPRIAFQGRPVFLIDASVFPGSSGSPVFVFDEGSFHDPTGGGLVVGQSRVILLGLVAAVYYKTEVNDIQTVAHAAGGRQVVVDKEMIDLGMVFNHRALSETIDEAFKQYNIK